jgi:hypothetical protein
MEVHRTPVGEEGRRAYVAFLAARAAQAARMGSLGWQATEGEISAAINGYLQMRLEAASRRHRPQPYPRHRDFVGACEEALVSFAFQQADLRLDYISHEILRRWTKELAVANFSYHVPVAKAPALRLWGTATLEYHPDELGKAPHLRTAPRFLRRGVSDWGDRVIQALPDAYEAARRLEPGNSWVPIYRVRAAVCARLGLSDGVFNQAFREFLARERQSEAPFRVNLDPTEFGSTPPTELPLKLVDRTGREQIYRVMTLIPTTERITV